MKIGIFVFYLYVLMRYKSNLCNLNLLAGFNLKGLESPSNSKMSICPNVVFKCCDIFDEIKI